VLTELVKTLSTTARTPSPIDTCLDMAIITDPAKWDRNLRQKLDAICARRLAGA
jgi:5'-methylthioadenosine phosphorylase